MFSSVSYCESIAAKTRTTIYYRTVRTYIIVSAHHINATTMAEEEGKPAQDIKTETETKHGRLSMEGMVDNAIRVCNYMLDPKSPGVPRRLLEVCSGVALVNTIEAGFFVSGSGGTGIVLRRDVKTGKWSPPSAIGTGGVGFGLVFGAEMKDIVMVLIDDAAVNALSGEAQVKLGGQMAVAVGPLGREAEGAFNVSNKGVGMTLTYSITKGLFAGVNLEGALVGARSGENKKFYNSDASPQDILFKEGAVIIPDGSRIPELHEKLTMMEQGKTLEAAE